MSAPSKKSVSFVSGSSASPRGVEMDPELARRLADAGATLVMLDFPVGTEFGIDMNVWNTGQRFKGVKMIPPGKHFVFWSAVSKEGATAPRTGFFHDFGRAELVARRYRAVDEDVVSVSAEDADRLRADLRNLDSSLGPYPYDGWARWVSLTDKVSEATLSRLEPTNGRIQSVTELVPEQHFTSRSAGRITEVHDAQAEPEPAATTSSISSTQRKSAEESEEAKLPKMRHRPGTEIRYTAIPDENYPKGATPAQITKHSMDSSYRLDLYLNKFKQMYGDQVSSSMAHRNQTKEVLGELQFAFVCFLVGQHYDSFEQWKRLVALFCTCDEALVTHYELYLDLINDLHFQIREVPDDFFVDIVSHNNFLVTTLSRLFAAVRTAPSSGESALDPRLRSRAEAFRANLSKKFDWDFDLDLEDEAPVVVELEQT